MENLDQLRDLARQRDATDFVAELGAGLFLIKNAREGGRNAPSAPPSSQPPSSSSYRTTQTRVGSETVDLHDVFGHQLAVWRIAKRAGNPFSDRVSVGRAPNCDIPLRLPYLSKLHAHFFLDDPQGIMLADNGSSNGTFLNGQRLLPGERLAVKDGDVVALGSVELSICDSDGLYRLLTGSPD